MSDISQQAKSGVSWVAISQIVQPGWEFVVGIILARILTPKDFGIFAMGVIFSGLATTISNMGIPNSLIQKNDLNFKDIRTAQAISILTAVIIYTLLFICSFFIKVFFEEPLAAQVLRLFGIIILINAITMIPAALMTRELKFMLSSIINISASLVYGISGMLLAYWGFGLWSLVYSPIVSTFYTCVVMCFLSNYMPKLGWDKGFAKHIFRFGGGLTLASIMNYAARNIDFLLIGKFLGPSNLGLYKRAYDLAVIPKEKVSDSLSSILLPFLCKVKNDTSWSKSAFLKTNKTIAIICVPVLLFSFVAAPEIVRVLYGPKWIGAIKSFQIMSLGGILYAIFVPFGSVMVAFGKTRQYLLVQCVYSALLLIMTLIGVNYGIEGVSIGVVISLSAVLAVCLYFIHDSIKLTFVEFACNLVLPIIIGLTVISMISIAKLIIDINNDVINLIIYCVIATLIYAGYLFYYNDKLLQEFRNELTLKINKIKYSIT